MRTMFLCWSDHLWMTSLNALWFFPNLVSIEGSQLNWFLCTLSKPQIFPNGYVWLISKFLKAIDACIQTCCKIFFRQHLPSAPVVLEQAFTILLGLHDLSLCLNFLITGRWSHPNLPEFCDTWRRFSRNWNLICKLHSLVKHFRAFWAVLQLWCSRVSLRISEQP